VQHHYAREIIGKRAFSNISGKRVRRTTLIAGYGKARLKAAMHFKGTTNTEIFNAWVEYVLVPELREGDVVRLQWGKHGNATFHRSNLTKNLIAESEVTLMYQRKYSPNMNKSEPQ
jgi:transposase